MSMFHCFRAAAATAGITLAALCGATHVQAGPFEVAISPSRFELTGKNTQRIGQSLNIYNLGGASTEVSVRTLDWSYSEDGNVTYYDELRPGSCRPWVTLERKLVKLAARGSVPFRFQIDIPLDASRGECRFMLAIEGVEPAHKALIESGGASLSLPVSGRIAVAVYVAVNGAQPVLEMSQVSTREIQGQRTPMVTVTNRGDAHGRLDGSLDAKDAKGVAFELLPEGTPVLPGQTRTLALTPRFDPPSNAPTITFPIKAKGMLDWDRGSFKIDGEFK